MSHKHAQVLRSLFHDPPPHNLQWREIESLLKHVGAEFDNLPGARLRVSLGKAEAILHRPHHGNEIDRQGVRQLRDFLAHAGITPSTLDSD